MEIQKSANMKAVVYEKSGNSKRLIFCDVPKPVPNDGEVLVSIVCASVNALDYRSMRLGIIPKNRIFGADISGIVEAVGNGVHSFKTGDAVIGDLSGCGLGGFAEYVAVPESVLVKKPADICFEDAAAIPVAAITALAALRKGNIKPGQKALIYGSGGGVGSFAVQLGKYFGAEVTAACSAKNAEQTVSLGANRIVDYTKEDCLKIDSYDLILAVNGCRPISAYRRALNPGGAAVIVGGALSQIMKTAVFGSLLSLGSKKIKMISAKSNRQELELLTGLVSGGKIKPVIGRRYPLEDTAEAVRYLSEGHAQGKTIISVRQEV